MALCWSSVYLRLSGLPAQQKQKERHPLRLPTSSDTRSECDLGSKRSDLVPPSKRPVRKQSLREETGDTFWWDPLVGVHRWGDPPGRYACPAPSRADSRLGMQDCSLSAHYYAYATNEGSAPSSVSN